MTGTLPGGGMVPFGATSMARLRRAQAADAGAVAHVLIESRRVFLPYAPSPHGPDACRQWVTDHLVPSGRVHVAEVGGSVVAVLATSVNEDAAWIDQLYVLPGYEGRGIGAQLLELAHRSLTGAIRLFTFQANTGARRFYERHGYRAISFGDGSSNDEGCPDVLYERASGAGEDPPG